MGLREMYTNGESLEWSGRIFYNVEPEVLAIEVLATSGAHHPNWQDGTDRALPQLSAFCKPMH